MHASKLWAVINVAVSIGLLAVFFLANPAPKPARQSLAKEAPKAQPVRPSLAGAAAPPSRTSVTSADWKAAIADAGKEWEAALMAGDPAAVSSSETSKISALKQYRYLLESMIDRSPANRARVLQFLCELKVAEQQVYLAAKKLKVRDAGEIERRTDEIAGPILDRLIYTSGPDGARIAELFPLRHTMGLFESSIVPTMQFHHAAMTVPQQIEIARLFERHGYADRNRDVYEREMASPGTMRQLATTVLNDSARVLSPDQIQALSSFFQEEEAKVQGWRDRRNP